VEKLRYITETKASSAKVRNFIVLEVRINFSHHFSDTLVAQGAQAIVVSGRFYYRWSLRQHVCRLGGIFDELLGIKYASPNNSM
jgi:hypothetical protein